MDEQTRFFWLIAQYTRDPSLVPGILKIKGARMLESGFSMHTVVENVITAAVADNTMNASNLNAMGLDVLRQGSSPETVFR